MALCSAILPFGHTSRQGQQLSVVDRLMVRSRCHLRSFAWTRPSSLLSFQAHAGTGASLFAAVWGGRLWSSVDAVWWAAAMESRLEAPGGCDQERVDSRSGVNSD